MEAQSLMAIYLYYCQRCGERELPYTDLQSCPDCGGQLRRIYRFFGVIVKRGKSDFAGMRPEDINAPETPEEKAIWREYGDIKI
jgi:putative FmdB family regulatory protein